jgi:redox-sensitive bicupin YhaK (pirin superfamily)
LRTIRKIGKGQRTVDGAGVSLVRVLGFHDTKDFDPFLMLDAFDSSNPDDYIAGFPWHPHRGIETITYLIQGDIEHSDSLGNKGSILDGDCQWMTAGSGIIHQEMPKASDRMLGAQLWLNLPAKDKMVTPHYGDIKSKDIPVITDNGSKVHIVAGEYQGTKGGFQGQYVKATYLDIELAAGSEWSFDNEPEKTLFIYIFSGQGIFDPAQKITEPQDLVTDKQVVLFSEGDRFWVKAGQQGIRFILISGPRLDEPIAWGGPIVMNTREELNQAFKELDNNTFIK